MKFIELLKRKSQLLGRKGELLEELEQATKSMNQKDIELFIQQGDMAQRDGAHVATLEKEQKHLLTLEKGLDVEISRTRKKERLKRLEKVNRKIALLEEKRTGPLHRKHLHFLAKIEELREEDREVKAEILTLRNQLHQLQSKTTFFFRLPGLNKALKEHYFAHPDELERMIQEAYRSNEKCFHANIGQPVPDRLVRGFGIILDTDSGEVLERKETVCDRTLAKKNPAVMKEVVK